MIMRMFCHRKTYSYLNVCLVLLLLEWCVCEDDELLVVSGAGAIRGVRARDGPYTMFLGIPYARVNASNVFGESIPVAPFQEEFKAYTISTSCPQELNIKPQSLDCLQLNIYVPENANQRSLLPVMLYIFGGGFSTGSAIQYGPKYLVRHNVILIIINYRLGPYGFFCLDTPEVPGNAALKDQVLALRWIKKNIKPFGGDPQQVTLFGHSSGSVLITLHLLSETEKLFSNVILMGLTELSPLLNITDGNTSAPLKLAKALNYEPANLSDALDFLATVDSSVLSKAATGLQFRPCLEKHFPGVQRFLEKHPLNSNYSKLKGMSLMVGYTPNESLFTYYKRLWSEPEEYPYIGFELEEKKKRELSMILKQFYATDARMNGDPIKHYVDSSSDVFIYYPTRRSIDRYLEAGADSVYHYVFSHDGGRNIIKLSYNVSHFPGATHGDEVGYLFDMEEIKEDVSAEDQLVIDRMTTLWTNFAKYRDPTPTAHLDASAPVRWAAVTRDSPRHYMDLGVHMTAGTDHRAPAMAFYRLLYKAYGRYERGLNAKPSDDLAPRTRTSDVAWITTCAIAAAAALVSYVIITKITDFITQH